MMARRNGPEFNSYTASHLYCACNALRQLSENSGYTPKLIPNLEPRGKGTHTGCPPPSSGKRGILVDLVTNTNDLERRGRFTQTRCSHPSFGTRRELKRLHSGKRRELKRLHSGKRRELKRLHSGRHRLLRRLDSLANEWDARPAPATPLEEECCDEHVDGDLNNPSRLSPQALHTDLPSTSPPQRHLWDDLSPHVSPQALHTAFTSPSKQNVWDDLSRHVSPQALHIAFTSPSQQNVWDDLSPQVSPQVLHDVLAFKRSGDRHFSDAFNFKTNRSGDRHYTDIFKVDGDNSSTPRLAPPAPLNDLHSTSPSMRNLCNALSPQVSPRVSPQVLHTALPSPPQRNLWDDLSPEVSLNELHDAFAFKRSSDRHFTDALKTNRSGDRHYTDVFTGQDLFW